MQTIADFPKLRESEKLGDPCSCGCGGVKVLPEKPTAKLLDVARPCQGCGKERVYQGPRQAHRQYCQPCAPRHRSWAWRKRDESVMRNGAFPSLLLEALDRKAMTVNQVCAEAGLNR